MMTSRPCTTEVYRFRSRTILGTLVISTAVLLIIGAWSIPFFFESSTMWYKFGLHKVLLRSGKIVGLTTALLVLFQVVLASRCRFLDQIFSLNRLYALHRKTGLAIALLILLHPTLILAADQFVFFGFGKKYWPEFVGLAMAPFFLSLVGVAHWRRALGLRYSIWLPLHRLTTPVAVMVLPSHILFVSDTYKSGLPRIAVFLFAALTLSLFLRIWKQRLLSDRRYVIARVAQTGTDATCLDVKIPAAQPFCSLPGQFAFITVYSSRVKREEHPFTLASTPSRPGTVQFIIRACGDWTNTVKQLQPGDTLAITGPYGLFSHLANADRGPLIMIAGGIGITPFLSMLRYLADVNDQRPLLLIWSNKTREHIILPAAFDRLQQQLPGLKIVHHLTRGVDKTSTSGRLTLQDLKAYLQGWDRKASVYLCGPPGMIQDMKKLLPELKFRNLYSEEFSL